MRTFTRDEVEAVVRETAQRYERSADAHMRAGEKRGEAFERGRVEGCHEVLRRLDALPEPPLPPQPIHSARHDGTFVPPLPVTRCAACLEESGHRPGCPFGQRQSNPLHGAEVPAGTLVETFPGSPFVRLEPRPRAMTPPPEVPALKDIVHARRANQYAVCGAEYDGMRLSSAPSHVTCPACPGEEVLPMTDEQARETLASAGITPARSKEGLDKCMAMVREAKATSEPTALDVAWEGEGVRVLADGTWVIESPVPVLNVISTLTRALAEALKAKVHAQDESAKLGPVLDVIREALKPYGCTFPGGGLVGIANGVDEVVHKAAESMRERAAKAVDSIIEDLSDRAGLGNEWDQIDEDVQERIRAKWKAIIRRALPLEES